jgi:hypothetical protein
MEEPNLFFGSARKVERFAALIAFQIFTVAVIEFASSNITLSVAE